MPVRLTLADQTVVAIEALLAVLPAGAVLPCEDALAVRFSVSRVTVRKALARLVARGMVAGGGRGGGSGGEGGCAADGGELAESGGGD
jgi:DNA-binding GntR family transcriptional regulator